MSLPIDRARLRDPVLLPIAEKVEAGARLTAEEGLALYGTDDLLCLEARTARRA